jgi:hypothetical protein
MKHNYKREQGGYGRITRDDHIAQPWRIHKIAPDFEVEDVWALPTPGGPNDFKLLIATLASGGAPEEGATSIGRLLWALRWKLGKWFGWDKKENGPASLQQRLPDELRHTNPPTGADSPFTPLYITDKEYAAELANSTMHGVMHMSWVENGAGCYRGQMAVLVKPNGFLGKFYMALIKPFRYLIIYPALMRKFERKWRQLQAKAGNAL